MDYIITKPKAFKFFEDALKYLKQHEINYIPIGKFKRQIEFTVENVYTQERKYVTLKIKQGKLYAEIASYDYEKHIEYFEEFTSIIHHLKFHDGKK
jgi:hypothetical protein